MKLKVEDGGALDLVPAEPGYQGFARLGAAFGLADQLEHRDAVLQRLVDGREDADTFLNPPPVRRASCVHGRILHHATLHDEVPVRAGQAPVRTSDHAAAGDFPIGPDGEECRSSDTATLASELTDGISFRVRRLG